jgi:alcohol dehydrogenase class IV
MWLFHSPQIAFGEDALSRLDQLEGQRAFIVTDANILKLGLVKTIQEHLATAGLASGYFAEVEPDPSLQTVRRCAALMHEYAPDWIIALGGGSCIDAAKAAWLLYERPDVDPAGINPIETFGVRAKARLVAIPTTSGTGSEATLAVVLTDLAAQRKLALGSRELMPDLAIVDPALVMSLPPAVTADTGLDALAHAIEGYTSAWRNDFSDGLCLKAIQLIFTYLPRSYANGADAEAREHMHNAATIAGLGFSNSMTALAHALGHALGAIFKTPHGRAVSLFLPYTIEFTANGGGTRYADIARCLQLAARDEKEGTASLVAAIRALQRQLNQPATVRELGIPEDQFVEAMPRLVANAESDTDLVTSARVPDGEELKRLFECAYGGLGIEF